MRLADSNLVCEVSISNNGMRKLRKETLKVDFHRRGSKVILPLYGSQDRLEGEVLRVRYFKQSIRVLTVKSGG